MIWAAVGLLVLGFLLIFLELMIPSFGMIALASVACFTASVVLAFMHGAAPGAAFTAIIVAGVPAAVFFAVKAFKVSPIGKRMILSGPGSDLSGGGASASIASLMGKRGTARTVLRPSGIADIEGKRVDVVSEGKMIDPGASVEVVRVDGNRVVVKSVSQ